MKFFIDGFEIEVKARMIGSKKVNKSDTMYFLNHLCCVHDDAAKNRHDEGYHAIARSYEKDSETIHRLLVENNFYD